MKLRAPSGLMRFLPLILSLTSTPVRSESNISPAIGSSHAYGANIGWINARGDGPNGIVIGEFTCSGYLYSANCGWIHMGDGAPADGIRYRNDAADDYGVNVRDYAANGTNAEAKLRGFAYGANIGWVQFENTGDPRINLATGELSGHAYGANIGWIRLGGAGVSIIAISLEPGEDSDLDGIPDNWERHFASGNLDLLSDTGDEDGDGETDLEEYLADTNPVNPQDRLQITAFVPPRNIGGGNIATDLAWTSKPSRRYQIETSPDLSAPFASVTGTITPASGSTTSRRISDAVSGHWFYRIKASHPLAP